MRKPAILPLLTLVFACGDGNPLQPDEELAVTPYEPALTVAAKRSDVKMVPLKMKGTWWYGDGDATPCIQFGGSVPGFIEWEGTSTHMGRVTGTATNCMDYSALPDGPPAIFSQTLEAVAANGDKLFGQGTIYDNPPIGLTVDLGVSFEIGPVLIDGGTGRFAKATGWYMLSGDYSLFEGNGGKYWIEGMISSVGSSK